MAYSSVNSFPIMALPAFILAGGLIDHTGISKRLVNLAEAIAGPVSGGMASATILACLFFGTIIGETTLEEIPYKALPFVAVTIGSVFLLAFIPNLTLWLPQVFGY